MVEVGQEAIDDELRTKVELEKFRFHHEDVILLRGFNANLGIESPN